MAIKTGKESQEMREMNGLEGLYLEDIEIGMVGSYAKTVTETDIVMFAGLSGDTNPVHLNQEFAETTMFEGRIAHGMLSAGFISTVLGTRLPGRVRFTCRRICSSRHRSALAIPLPQRSRCAKSSRPSAVWFWKPIVMSVINA